LVAIFIYDFKLTYHKVTKIRLGNDLYCVEWGVKLYSLTPQVTKSYDEFVMLL